MPANTLTIQILRAAIEGFELQKQRIDAQIAEITQMIESDSATPAVQSAVPRSARKMTAAGRKRIGDAQRKRWAESRSKSGSPSAVTSGTKRKLSAAGRKAIVAALKKRWADKKASLVTAGTATATKSAARKADSKKTAK